MIPALRGIRAGIGFLTTLPVNVREGDHEEFARRVYVFFIVGIITGVLIGIAGLIIQSYLPMALVPILVILCIYLFTGINHVDGISDLGDGLVVCGTVEKKIKAMKDVHVGAGGVFFIVICLLALYAAISFAAGAGISLFLALFCAEIGAKAAMATAITFGKSLGTGMGAVTIAGARKSHYVIGLVIAAILCWVAMGVTGILVLFATVMTGLILAYVAKNNFGGVNGDVIGATNEIARVVAIIAAGAVLWMPW